MGGGKPPRVKAHPRPRLAAQRVAERRVRRIHDSLNARLYPTKAGDD